MDIVGKKVTHSIFGDGKVTMQDDISIEVDFDGETKRFLYPQAFDHHLTAKDDEIHETLSEQAGELISEEEKQIQEDIEARRRERLSDPEVIAKRERARRSSAAGRQKDIAFRFEDILATTAANAEEADAEETSVDAETVETETVETEAVETEAVETEAIEETPVNVAPEDPDALPIVEEWKVDAGYYKSGKREGQPIVMREARRHALAMLTYVKPDQEEADRVIFAVFLASSAFEGDDKTPGYLSADSKYRLQLTEEEASQLLYWNYYANKNRSARTTWGSGQFRYIEQPMGVQVMRDIAKLKEGTEDEALAKEFYDQLCQIQNIIQNSIPEPEGTLIIHAEDTAEEEAEAEA